MKMNCENRLLQTISLLDARTWVPQQEHRLLDGFWLHGLLPRDACIMFTLNPSPPKFKLPHRYLYNLPYSEIQNRRKMLDVTHSHPQSTKVNNFYGVEHIKCIYIMATVTLIVNATKRTPVRLLAAWVVRPLFLLSPAWEPRPRRTLVMGNTADFWKQFPR